MDMRGQPERRFAVHLEHQERYRFISQASEDGVLHGERYASDEPDPVGDNSGPSTPALLGSALGHCLSAALLEALRHAHVDVSDCETDAVAVVIPNEKGLPRIDHVDVTIRPRIPQRSHKADHCADIFQNYCTVTQSVKRGVDVRVQVEFQLESAREAAEEEQEVRA
jgi:organic hydroperoxide reductase OsmC/OhrA